MRRKAEIQEAVRCAIYTRKSTDEGLDQDFNSLDAQREAGEAFILSRKHEGWVCLKDRYDDGGFSGGDIKRPALKRLLADMEAGRIDAIVCYKVDRLSRSLLDFSQLIEVFDRCSVTFVSVTQPINTGDSSGRLMLNVLLSFAQFEREMIADRTRDKIAAARKKGKWTGGLPVLGYDIHPNGGLLVVNEAEAETVRQIFTLYQERGSLMETAAELNRRGWRTKSWVTRKGVLNEGSEFNKGILSRLLTNPLYVGKTRLYGNVYDGEQPGIVDQRLFDQVETQLTGNRHQGGAHVKNRYGHILRGLLYCTACGAAMSPSATRRKGKAFRYYVCGNAARTGWSNCPCPSLPAKEIEDAVVERIKCVGQDPDLVAATMAELRTTKKKRHPALVAERRRLEREVARLHDGGQDADAAHAVSIEARLAEIAEELMVLESKNIDKREVARALAMFDEVWTCLLPREQQRILSLLIERIDFDATKESLAITFQSTGIKTLSNEIAEAQEVAV